MAKYLITGVSGFVARRFIWVKIVRSPPPRGLFGSYVRTSAGNRRWA